ncbi:MAG: AAA family ATPase [Fimbriimonadaceae bacterium]|nr:AAA family ATPase [Fimbriimonadaceae bacterium]
MRARLERAGDLESLIEVVLDYGRAAEARYRDRVERFQDIVVSELDLEFVSKSIGEFGSDNRAGIERTLHRISAIRNRHSKIVGLTCRVGRALEGTIDMIDDIVRSGKSILLLGKPGVGKTTKLREIARVLADEVGKRVVIVDTSNEIAGDGDVPHPGIGYARRMQVRNALDQHGVMIEAVENHMPEVIVIDEIGTEQEAFASRTIAERGVQLVGTAHGQTLENLMLNPTLADLIGGIQAVTLSDAEASRRGTQKTVLERKAPPTFDVVVELLDYDRCAVHHEVMRTVDTILRGGVPRPEIRVRTGKGVEIVANERGEDLDVPGFNAPFPALARKPQSEAIPNGRPGRNSPSLPARTEAGPTDAEAEVSGPPRPGEIRIFPYGIARTRLERAIREKRVAATVVNDIAQADAIMAIKSSYQNRPKKLRDLAGRPIPTVVVKSNTFSQISGALEDILRTSTGRPEDEREAMAEVEAAIEAVLQTNKPFELSPATAPIRKMQIQFSETRKVACECVGAEPNRRLRLLPLRI